ncbi:MAG: MarC family protein [Elusimicrobiota bacterium]|jgi:multiple antibiotic resistance protein|nr:MarC family protein [Elusimicrobiota bacterium]
MEIIFSAVITLFLVMDPFGNIPLFISSLNKVKHERRMFVILRELIIAFAIMLAFLFVGRQILNILGIAQYSMSMAGGIILFIISVNLVFNNTNDGEENKSAKDEEPFVVPLAIPLIAGPASLSMLLILSSTHGTFCTLSAMLISSALNAAILLLSFPISSLLGRRGLIAIERLSGMLLVLVSVNMVMGGITEFIKLYN